MAGIDSHSDTEMLLLDNRMVEIKTDGEYMQQVPGGQGYVSLNRDVRNSMASKCLYSIMLTEDGLVDIKKPSKQWRILDESRVRRFKRANDKRITTFVLFFEDGTSLRYWYTRTRHAFRIRNEVPHVRR